ncbi:MAG TPA: M48 family metallopeptidase [Methylomirabilota bacterium]|jgi:predicted Zn-dependent protease|nr:M48 family metallopeptidase [Methylomirabilota bacterium]
MRGVRLASVLLAVALLAGCETVPVTGRSQLNLISPAQEAEMGLQAYQGILKKAKLSTDPAANALVKRVGTRIAGATGRGDLPWEFNVIDDAQTVNAFALPGGKVAVYTGILPITRDENGLAVVLGHEVSHVMARHSAERVSDQLLVQLGAAAIGTAFGLSAEVTQAGANILASGLLLPWGRRQESEADHLGLVYMAKAGYDPRAARDLWIRMAEASKGRSRPPEFLSTHPSEETRVQQIEGWLPEALRYYRPAQ